MSFVYLMYVLSILFYIASFITATFFLVPLQFKQALVKNGLSILRRQMLRKGMLSIFVSLAGVIVLTSRFYVGNEIAQIIIPLFVLVNSFCFFLIVLIGSRIYHYHYTDKNIRLHERLDKLEKMRGGKE